MAKKVKKIKTSRPRYLLANKNTISKNDNLMRTGHHFLHTHSYNLQRPSMDTWQFQPPD